MHEADRKDKLYVASLSGGKDSTAMVLRLIEESRPLDLILFCDTGLEFPQMYEHVRKLTQSISVPVVCLKADKGFEYYFLHHSPKRKNPNLTDKAGFSWAGPRNRWCTSVLKTRVINRYLSELRKEHEIVQYIGIAADEPKRVREFCYPLVEWGMTEKDCLGYCYERGYDWGGLYELFRRVSCWCCADTSLNCGNSSWNGSQRHGGISGQIILWKICRFGSGLKKKEYRTGKG